MSTVQPSTPSTFHIPELSRPAPAVSVEFRRSPASSFSKSTRPIGSFDLPRLSVSSASLSTLPPPYPHDHDRDSRIPEYGENQEVQTMARSLFLYGFMFPPFWVLGALILVTPLTPDPSWYNTKSEHQIQSILSVMRATERRWAWRCVMALVFLILLVLIIVGSILLAHHLKRH
ncbi:hypothetical protein CPB86DRAFT_692975 [Serendipita vermifera]|nr:hypothetical protein CPB86DRAFT_692975 [Serendipita vermifera]